MSRAREESELRQAITTVSYTPGRRDFAGLCALLADEGVTDAVERAFVRAGAASARFLAAAFSSSRHPVRARIVRVMGRLSVGQPELARWLEERLLDEDPKVRRNAVIALGKVGGPSVEQALLAAWEREGEVYQRRSIAEALGKVGGGDAVALLEGAHTGDPELRRIVDAALLRLRGRTSRAEAGAPLASIDPQADVSGLEVVWRCRRGLEDLVLDEARGAFPGGEVRVVGPGVLRARVVGPLSSLYAVRTALGFGFALPLGAGAAEHAAIESLTSEAARHVFERLSRGGVRYRLEWAGAGKRRAAVFHCAEEIARRRPELINDPSERNWEVVVRERREGVEVELIPRLPDPRFAFRRRDVPAASHPTLAAALARLAGARDDDVVWDPFVGSGLELAERARLGSFRALVGTDRDAAALAAARVNLEAAGVQAALRQGDALTEAPAGVTLILTNPPMGRRVLRHEDLGNFFDRFVEHAAGVLSPGGRMVWISPLPPRTADRAVRAGLEVAARRTVDMGGFDAEIQVLRKRHRKGG